MRPSTPSPTGTEIGAPVSFTSLPRLRPSASDMATARTQPSPRCCCTSSVSWAGLPFDRVIDGERVVEFGQVAVGEFDIDDGADDLDDFTDVGDGGGGGDHKSLSED